MRQLASTFVDGKLRYYVTDSESDAIEEIAIIKPGPGFKADASGMVALGFGLLHEAGYNGHKKGAARQPAQVAESPVQQALPPAPSSKQRQAFGPRRRHRLTIEQVIDYIRKHPGSRPTEIGAALLPGTPDAGQVVNNRIYQYETMCGQRGIKSVLRKHREAGNVTRYYVDD